MNTPASEHQAVHSAHDTPHMKYWHGVKEKAEDCVRRVLEGGEQGEAQGRADMEEHDQGHRESQ
jgi:hypothetical protein